MQTIKTILFFTILSLLALSSLQAESTQPATNRYHYDIHRKDYELSTMFEIDSDDTYPGVVKKSVFRVRTNYDLSDIHGWQATGIKRIASLGSFYPWATEVDIYDTQWEWMGMIDGQVVSTTSARFSIYDAEGQLVGIAYLDNTLEGYTITYPDSEAYPIARLTRQHQFNGADWWSVVVYDADQIDERILRIFAAMACDIQDSIDEYYSPKVEKKVDLEDSLQRAYPSKNRRTKKTRG